MTSQNRVRHLHYEPFRIECRPCFLLNNVYLIESVIVCFERLEQRVLVANPGYSQQAIRESARLLDTSYAPLTH